MRSMKMGLIGTVGTAIALLGATIASTPANAQEIGVVVRTGSGIQVDKNIARNVGIGLGAAAAYEFTQGRGKAGLALGLGAVAAGERYEVDRRIEDRGPVVAPIACYSGRPVVWGVACAAPVRVEVREPVRYERPVVFIDPHRAAIGHDHNVVGHDARGIDRHDGFGRY